MADMAELKNIVRLGKVMSVDKKNMTARVKYEDKGGITSSPLHIIKRKVCVAAKENGTEAQTAQTELEYDVQSETKKVMHYHEAYVTEWVPNINATVLCIMTPDGDGDGFIIGEV